MNITYRIYYLDKFTTSGELVLIPEKLNAWNDASPFDSEYDAVKWLIDNKKNNQDYIILKHFSLSEQ